MDLDRSATHEVKVSELPTLLRAAMARKGDSQIDIARYINNWLESDGCDMSRPQATTSQAAVSKWLSGKAKPQEFKYPALASYLGITEGKVSRAVDRDTLPESTRAAREEILHLRREKQRLEAQVDDLTAELGDAERANRELLRRLAAAEKRMDQTERVVAATAADAAQARPRGSRRRTPAR